MTQKKIKYEYGQAQLSYQTVPVVRLFYGEERTEITLAFAMNKRLPLLPVQQEDGSVIFAALATEGKETIKVWSKEFVTACELHGPIRESLPGDRQERHEY